MSQHFTTGTYGAYADTGPGSIIVDPTAEIHATGNLNALSLTSGPWQVTINGNLTSDGGDTLYLQDTCAFVSNVSIGAGTTLSAMSLFRMGLNAAHATNVTNAGHINANYAGINETGNGDFKIENKKAGVIETTVQGINIESMGTHTIINAGVISSQTAIHSLAGIEKVTNYGEIVGAIDLGDGNDVFTNFHKVGKLIKHGSVIAGGIDLGAGDDKFFGGIRAETVKDGNGADTVKLGGGNDTWIGYLGGNGDLIDRIDGGKGVDTYDASEYVALTTAEINLDSISHLGVPANVAVDFYANTPHEIIRNFENAIGSGGNDVIWGTAGANKLWGGDGNDSLFGLGGNDRLDGGAGTDQLIGGAGKDEMWGGADADSFAFGSLKDSGRTGASRDVIHDFELGIDQIDLARLNFKLGDIITDFLGVDVAFTGHKGDLRAVTSGEQTIVQLDVNGDKKADFSIALDGHRALTLNDFYIEI